ncbi:MAG: hypothetical protein WAQ28_14000 [Bacteroidia bacterium]
MKKLVFVILSSISLFAIGQQQQLTREQFIKDSLHLTKVVLIRPQFKFDNRLTFYGNQVLSINGFDAGVLLKEKLRFTLGYYSLKDQLKAFNEVKENEKFGKLIKLNYGSLNMEIVYKDYRYLSFGMPFEIAAGVNTFQDKNITTGEVLSTKSGALAFANFGLSATFKPMRFIGLKGIAGYRKVAFNQVDDFNFDGFFTSIGLNLDIRTLITDYRMYKLKKRYRIGNNISNAVDIITN